MMLAAKHFDPVLGVDIHIIQPPGPVPPIPIPHPHIGFVIDPFDYVPMIGATIMVGGIPRAIAGTAGKCMPPHIPIGGVFVKPPSNENEIFMGSSTVAFDGDAASYMALPALSCQCIGMVAPFRLKKKSKTKSLVLPTTVVLPIPVGMPVLVGGPPTISLMALGMRAGMAGLGKGLKKLRKLQKGSQRVKRVSNRIHRAADKVLDKLKVSNKARNKVHRKICAVTGHPVDVVTGKVFTEAVDLDLPGSLPFEFERVWYSTSTHRGALGHGWHHSYDMSLVVKNDVIVARLADGRYASFEPPGPRESSWNAADRLELRRLAGGFVLEEAATGLSYAFEEPSDERVEQLLEGRGYEILLSRVEDRSGHRVQLRYREQRLVEIIDSADRELAVTTDGAGRILRISAPDPIHPGRQVTMVAYRYDAEGNLVEVIDALGRSSHYTYRDHLMVRETDRTGLSFYFEYDGSDEGARCLHTWGDGGIYDHKLTYDPEEPKTIVENSLGHQTTYFHDGALPTTIVDALGRETHFEYSESKQLLAETDALGGQTLYEYDDRGNCTSIAGPDGSALTVDYENDQPVAAVDAAGGAWGWRYDDLGQLVERTDPLGRTTSYEYADGQLIRMLDPAEGATRLAYDSAGNLKRLETPDGEASTWRYDALGRCIAAVDPKGNEQRRHHDLLGRVLDVAEPDGNQRQLNYDGEGNLTRATDRLHDIRFAYAGMGRMVSRTEAGTHVEFLYDTEEQLLGIKNEHGFAYRFDLDPTGDVVLESGFDGVTRRYQRDAEGRVAEVERASGLVTRYQYDPAGRVTAVEHSDGSAERYAYRPDGELLEAENDAAVVRFERDELGRVIKEHQGDHWVESTYDLLGMRVGAQSSLGADVAFERNVMGDVEGVTAGTGAKPWEAKFERDALGLELERQLPGGVRSRWQRDKVGRPVRQEIWAGAQKPRTREYTWDVNDRLRQIQDSWKGLTKFGHDAVGNLAWAQFSDNTFEYRMPDAVGNLFRTTDRSDRKYGPAGQLLESRDKLGTTRYEYDAEGNLVKKVTPDGVWIYRWNGSGMLEQVVRPDQAVVSFTYDAIGRRLSKTYRGRKTCWVWDGNNPLHEWVEKVEEASEEDVAAASVDALAAVNATRRADLLSSAPANGPPADDEKPSVITWIFEPESFSPLAKLVGEQQFSIVSDHLGTPVSMHDAAGEQVWAMEMGVYGQVQAVNGEPSDCPFRWPGQYEDEETGLYYNRFRYYDPGSGCYISQDPIGLDGGFSLHGYGSDPNILIDPLGLSNKYRKANGRFDIKPVHGNAKTSQKPAVLYALYDGKGNFKKWGITQEVDNPRKRYRNTIPDSWDVVTMEKGSRADMLSLERELVENDPGPLNKEKWAGKPKQNEKPMSKRAQKVCR